MEIKRNIWIKRFTLVFRLFLIVFGFGIWNYIIDSYAKEEKVSNNDELYVESNEKNLFLETENLEFLDNFVNLEIISNKKISEVSIINDYDLNIETQDFKFIVSFYCEENVEDEIKFKIIYDDLTYNFYELYFVSNQYGVFMSDTTIDDAFDSYLDYLTKNNMLVEEYSNNTKDTFVEGRFYWVDDIENKSHPLRYVLINIYDDEPGDGFNHLGTVYTDENGYFKFVFQNKDSFFDFENGGYDIYLEIISGDENILVRDTSGNIYKYETGVYKNIETGSTAVFSQTFYMDDELGQAFQISQAIMVARNFANEMQGFIPRNVDVFYPIINDLENNDIKECYYDNNSIYIADQFFTRHQELKTYSSWDVLMHEYAHHIENLYDIVDPIKQTHYFQINMIDNIFITDGDEQIYFKDDAIKIAWYEAWATFYSQLVQEYYHDILFDIKYVSDLIISSYNQTEYFFIEDSDIFLGEGCESSISSILWDIFDKTNEENDNISLGYKKIWEVTTIRNTYTFSEFINNFYDKYPSYKTKLGDNISQYNFAANEVSISESELSFDNPPIINISNNGGSIVFPNDSYTLYFYDSYNLVYLKIDSITTNQFQIPIKEWHKICKNSDSIVSFRIGCNQNEIPKTGEYLSKLFSFKKPDFNYLTDDFYVTNDLNYKEFSYSPMGGQKVLINLRFENSNRYIIQTFGRVFTSITIFDENMNELLFDKYSGFENNALINYYFEKNAEYNLLITTSSYVRYSILRTNSLVTDFDNIDKKYGEEYPGTYNSRMTGKTEILRFGVEFTNGYNFEVIADFDSIIYLIDPSDYRILGEYYSTSVENDNQSDSINAKAYTNIFDEEEILIIICSKTEVENENYILNIY